MFVPRMRRKVLGIAAALVVALGGSVAAATSAGAATADSQYELCAHGTYASFLAFDWGVYKSPTAYPGQCVRFTWPAGYDAYVWGQYSPGNNFLVGTAPAAYPGNIDAWGDEGPGDYLFFDSTIPPFSCCVFD